MHAGSSLTETANEPFIENPGHKQRTHIGVGRQLYISSEVVDSFFLQVLRSVILILHIARAVKNGST